MMDITIGSLTVLILILASASNLTILVDIVAGASAGAGAGAGAADITTAVAVAVASDDSDDERHGSLKEILELEGVVPLPHPLGSVPCGGSVIFTGENSEQETLGQPNLLGRRAVQVDGGEIGLKDVKPQVGKIQLLRISDILEAEILTEGGTGVPRIDEVAKTVNEAKAGLEEGDRVVGVHNVGDSHSRDGFEPLVNTGGPKESQE